jgi:hypothetical protein
MGLTWRDAVSGAAIMLIIFTYVAYLAGGHLLLVSSVWSTSAAIMVIGLGCAVTATGDLYTRVQPRAGVVIRRVTAGIGLVGLGYGLAAVLMDSAFALRNLVAMIIILWGTATVWHAFTMGSGQ